MYLGLLKKPWQHTDAGHSVYSSRLDTKKAYDSVWQNTLLYILYKAGLNSKTWRMLIKFYDNFKCYVKVGNDISDCFLGCWPCATTNISLLLTN